MLFLWFSILATFGWYPHQLISSGNRSLIFHIFGGWNYCGGILSLSTSGWVFLLPVCSVAQPCSILCSPMDCSSPGSSVHGIFQARVLEWIAIPFSRVSSWPRDRIQVSHIAGRFFTVWPPKKPKLHIYLTLVIYSCKFFRVFIWTSWTQKPILDGTNMMKKIK